MHSEFTVSTDECSRPGWLPKTCRAARLCLSLLLALVSVFAAVAGQDPAVNVTYTFDAPRIQLVNDEYTRLSIEGGAAFHQLGQPEVPFRTGRILLPLDAQVKQVDVELLEEVQTLTVTKPLWFGRTPVPIGVHDHPSVARAALDAPDKNTYSADVPYPASRAQLVSVQKMDGYSMAIVRIFPIQYRPVSGTLLFCPRLRVSVTLAAAAVQANAASTLRAQASRLPRVKAFVDNPDEAAAYKTPSVQSAQTLTVYDYLLITTAALTNSFQPLVAQKIADGLSVKVATVESILAGYSGVDDAAKLRTFITYAYTNWNTTYVLLGGDISTVPYRQAYADCDGVDATMPCDLYFACLDGSWNSDGDSNWGEPTDGEGGGDVDLLAEVYVGRAPVDDAAEVANFIGKTLYYEQNGHANAEDARFLAEYLGNYSGTEAQGGDGLDVLLPSFSSYNVAWLDDRPTNGETWDSGDCVNALNLSPHLVAHDGHANETYALRMVNGDVDDLTNAEPFLLNSLGCYCGAFDYSDCFAEELVKRNEYGAFAVLMNSRYGWFDSTSEGMFSGEFMAHFFDELLVQGNRSIGVANQLAKQDMLGSVETSGSGMVYRWCYFEITLFGDPHTRVQAGDDLGVSPFSSFDTEGYVGGPFVPSAQVYSLTNVGAGSLTWTAAVASGLVGLSSSGGTLTPGGSATVTATLVPGVLGFTAGSYSDTIVFSNTLSGATKSRAVKLRVQGEMIFSTGTYAVAESGGGTVLITVLRHGNTNRAVTVDFATGDDTATAGSDYVATNGTLTFAVGETRKSFRVTILDDGLLEGDETVALTLSNPTGGGTVGDPNPAWVTIADDEMPPSGVLTTTFASDNGASGNMFDIVPKQTLGIEALDVNVALSAGQTSTVTLFYRDGTSFGHESNSNDWILLGTRAVTAAGSDLPTHVDISGNGIRFLQGQTYGLYVHCDDGLNYTNGSNTYENAAIRLIANCGKNTPLFTGGTFTPRTWNGAIYYDMIYEDDLVVNQIDGLRSSGYEGGPFRPWYKVYMLTNAGSATVTWTDSAGQDWVTLQPAGGTLSAGASTSVTVSIDADANTLSPGLYEDTLVFSNTASGYTQGRNVAVTVVALPGKIGVTDSIAPAADLYMPFGPVIVGLSRTEQVTVTNADLIHDLVIQKISVQDTSRLQTSPTDLRIALPATKTTVARASGYLPAGWAAPSRQAQELVVPKGYLRASAVGIDVLVLATGEDPTVLRAGLAAFPDIGTVDFVDGAEEAPTVESLSEYDAVIVASNYGWLDAEATGDALADYVDAGGCVVEAVASFAAGGPWGLAGRFVDDGYEPFVHGAANLIALSLGDYDATHPLMEGVATLDDSLTVGVDLTAGATWVADWNDGTPLVAVQESGVVGINIFPYDSGYYSGDAVLLFHNAVVYASGIKSFEVGEIPEMPYSLPPGESLTFDVTYAPRAVGTNAAALVIASNDVDEPEVAVALAGVGMPDYLDIQPETGLSGSGHPGGPFLPDSQTYVVSNSSSVAISWAIGNYPLWVSVTLESGTLEPGASVPVTVTFNAEAASLAEGAYSDELEFCDLTTTIVQTRPLALEVFTTPVVQVAPTAITVTNLLGQARQTVLQIGNAAWADAVLNFSLGASEVNRSPLHVAATPAAAHDFTRLPEHAEYRAGELLVRFDTNTTGSLRLQALAAAGGGTVTRAYTLVPGLTVVKLADGTDMATALVRFNQTAGIRYAQPIYRQKALRTPNDPMFGDLWGMDNTSDIDINAPEAWEIGVGGPAVTVAVIDTGIDYTHEDLAPNMWRNPGEIPGNGIDDDFNGYVDDVYGYDFCNGDADPRDDHDHGTHCAGTIGAVGDNGVGVAGVCWNVRIMAMKFLDASGNGDTDHAISCIEYAVQMGAKVLSNSWGGGPYEQALKDAIDAAGAADVLVIAAAGNDYGNDNDEIPSYPASYESDNIVSVMSIDDTGAMSDFSNYGLESVDLGAPGSDILSCQRGGGYQYMSGTSMATPHVAGACALLLSLNSGFSGQQVKNALLATTDASLPGLCVAGGRMNLAGAVTYTPAWLSVSPVTGGDVAPGAGSNVMVTADAGMLAAGTYEGLVTVRCNDRDTPVTNVPVTMVIVQDTLKVQPSDTFIATGCTGGPFVPASKVYVLTNAGSASLSWTAGGTASWVSASPASGTLAAGQSMQVTVAFAAPTAALPPGDYMDDVVFSNRTSTAVQYRQAQLTVLERVFDHFMWGWIAPTQYVGQSFAVGVTAIDNGGSVWSNFTDAIPLYAAKGSASQQSVLSGSNAWNYPLSTFYHDARTQVIYLNSELGASSLFTALSLYVSVVPGQEMYAWTIRLKHTSLAGYSSGTRDWQTDDWTVVVQTNVTLTSTGWVTFNFTTPFRYNGTDNLLVDFSFNNTSYSTDGYCWATGVSANRSLCYRTDSGYGDPLTWSGTTPGGDLSANVPVMRIERRELVPMTPALASNFVNGVWSGNVTVWELATNVTLCANDGAHHVGISDPFDAISDSVLPLAWLLSYGLSTDGSADYTDTDNDGMNNRDEWVAGTVPTNGLSFLQLQEAVAADGGGGVRVRWQSVFGKLYWVESCETLTRPVFFTPFVSNVLGRVGSTEVLDPRPATNGSRFYHVGVQE